MNVTRIEERMSAMQTCIDSARCLNESRVYSIPNTPGALATREEEIDRQRLSRGKVGHMLCAVALEIAIKVLWELEHRKACRHTHDIKTLYNELNIQSQQQLKKMYDEKMSALAALEGTQKDGKHVRIGEIVQFASLKEALDANEDTMRNFKYDNKFTGKSSAMGIMMWNSQRQYVLPPLQGESFIEALFRYTREQIQNAANGTN